MINTPTNAHISITSHGMTVDHHGQPLTNLQSYGVKPYRHKPSVGSPKTGTVSRPRHRHRSQRQPGDHDQYDAGRVVGLDARETMINGVLGHDDLGTSEGGYPDSDPCREVDTATDHNAERSGVRHGQPARSCDLPCRTRPTISLSPHRFIPRPRRSPLPLDRHNSSSK